MSFDDQPLIVFSSTIASYDLLKRLSRGSSEATTSNSAKVMPVSYLEQLPDSFDRTVWDQWIADFESPPELTKRGLELIASYDLTEQAALSSINATKRLNAWSYPLTIGMAGGWGKVCRVGESRRRHLTCRKRPNQGN